jgi:hypothetical protein
MPDSNNVPVWVHETLTAYVETGRPTGDFLAACLSNDFMDAIGRADNVSLAHIGDIAAYIYNRIPGNSWGSREIVRNWIEHNGQEAVYGKGETK